MSLKKEHATVSRTLHLDIDDETATDLYKALSSVKGELKGWGVKALLTVLEMHVGQTCDNCEHFDQELNWGDLIACKHPGVNYKTTDAKAFRKDGCPMWEPKKEQAAEA